MIKATPNYPLCISARPGPSWCVRGLFWKRDKLTSGKIFPDVCSRMRGVIPASPPEKFFLGFFIRSFAFNLSTCSNRRAQSSRSATLSLLLPASPCAKFCTGRGERPCVVRTYVCVVKRLFINMWAIQEVPPPLSRNHPSVKVVVGTVVPFSGTRPS